VGQSYTKAIPIDTDVSLGANSDLLVPSQKAVKTYISNQITSAINDQIGRSDWVAPYSYCGVAPVGSLEGNPVWTIYRITVANDGSSITQSATSVTWTGRYSHVYI
jgi:hypothetical protein